MANKECECVPPHWSIDSQGNGICMKCRATRKFATPSTLDNFVSKQQRVAGKEEIDRYLYKMNLMPR